MGHRLYIKNMVCDRCITAVQASLLEVGIQAEVLRLGEVQLAQKPSSEKLDQFKQSLESKGFELISDHRSQLIEKVKSLVVEQVHHKGLQNLQQSWSEFITSQLPHEYKYLSRLFSSVEGITLEQYIIRQKIERAKELIVYDQLSLSEIAWELSYSSVGHLSSQFKKVTGLAPSAFREIGRNKRKPLDQV